MEKKSGKGNPETVPSCPVEGWELLMPISDGRSEAQWTACSDGTGQPGGIMRILHIPAFSGETDLLRSGNFSDDKIRLHYEECAARCLSAAEKLKNADMPHIPEIIDVAAEPNGEYGFNVFILSKYYPTFSEYFADKKVNRAVLLSLCCDICDSISEYHSLGLSHNNIQLENVYVTEDGRCLLGNPVFEEQLISRLQNPEDTRLLRFMAPEVAGGKSYDIRSDIYSLGLTMYFKFNMNRLPFVTSDKGLVTRSEAERAILKRIKGEKIPSPARADEKLSSIILRACAYSAEDRYDSAYDLRRDIAEYAEHAGIKLLVPETSAPLPQQSPRHERIEAEAETEARAVAETQTETGTETVKADKADFYDTQTDFDAQHIDISGPKNEDMRDELSFKSLFEEDGSEDGEDISAETGEAEVPAETKENEKAEGIKKAEGTEKAEGTRKSKETEKTEKEVNGDENNDDKGADGAETAKAARAAEAAGDAELSSPSTSSIPLQSRPQNPPLSETPREIKEIKTDDRKNGVSDLNGYFDEAGNFIPAGTLRSDDVPDKADEEQDDASDKTIKTIKKSREKRLGRFSVGGGENVAENTEENPADDSLFSGDMPKSKADGIKKEIPIFKIAIAALAFIAVLVFVIVMLQKCSPSGGNSDIHTDAVNTTDTDGNNNQGSIKMPDLSGMNKEEVLKALSDAGYDFEPMFLGDYSSQIKNGAVMKQYPEKDLLFDADTTVKVTLSLGKAPDKVPDVINLSSEDAAGRLQTLGFKVTVLHSYSDTVSEDNVILQSIAPNTEIVKDADIFIVISKGGKPAGYTEIETMTIGDGVFAVKPGDSKEIALSIFPENAAEKEVWWTSSAPDIVSIDQNGKVTAHAVGSSEITVYSADGVHSGTCTVEVKEDIISVEKIGFRLSSSAISVGQSETHAPWLYPDNVTNTYVTFSSSNPSVVRVNAYGTITGVTPGTAVITARSSDGGFTASYTVTVTVPDGKSAVPPLIGLSAENAAASAADAGLSYSVIYAVSGTVPKGTVISQSINTGTLVDAGTVITITVSNGNTELSDWTEVLPDGVSAAEQKTQYSYREKQTVTQADSPVSGWTVDDSLTSYGAWSSFGEWQTAVISSSDTVRVESQTFYRSRSVEPWTAWSMNPILESPDITVETRTVYSSRTYETMIRDYYTQIDGWSFQKQIMSQILCDWTISEPPEGAQNIESATINGSLHYRWTIDKVQYQYIRYSDWSEWSTSAADGVNTEVRTGLQYRSRPANPYGAWSGWTSAPISPSASLDVESEVMYRSSTRTVTYTCYSYTDWSDWSDAEVNGGRAVEVRTRTLYRYKIAG